jgi:hypothetical protein
LTVRKILITCLCRLLKRKAPRGEHGFDNYSNPNTIPTPNFNPNNLNPSPANLSPQSKPPFPHTPPAVGGGGLLPLPNTPPLIPYHQTATQQVVQQTSHQTTGGLLQNPSIANINSNLNTNVNPNINPNLNPPINPILPTKTNPPQPNPPLLHQPGQPNLNPPNRPNSPPAPLLQTPPIGPGPLDTVNPLTSLGNFFKSLNLSPNLPMSKLPANVLNNIPPNLMNNIPPNFTIGNFLQQLQQIQMQQQPSFAPPPAPVSVQYMLIGLRWGRGERREKSRHILTNIIFFDLHRYQYNNFQYPTHFIYNTSLRYYINVRYA